VELPRRNEVRKCDRRLCEGENMMKDLSDLLQKNKNFKESVLVISRQLCFKV